VLLAALARLDAVQCLVLPLLRERDLTHIVGEVRPDAWVGPGGDDPVDFVDLARRSAADAGHDLPVWSLPDLLTEAGAVDAAAITALPGLTDDPADPARWVFFTSGTTGPPKGVLHSDDALAVGGIALAEHLELTAVDVFPVAFAITHVGGMNTVFAHLWTGMRLIVAERFEGDDTLDWFAGADITVGSGGTTLVQLMLRRQRARGSTRLYPRLRCALGGQAPKPRALQEEIRRELGGMGVVSVYGMTEAPSAVMCDLHDPVEILSFTEGRPIDGVALRVVDEQGVDVPVGVTGELCFRGRVVCLGYVDAAYDRDAFDADGWLHSGDLGHLTPEGCVVVSGRIKDVIIRKGENISAKAVEDLLYEHPDVLEVAVIGVPDDERGEMACAVLVPADPGDPLTLDQMVAHCRDGGLAVVAIPERLEVVDVLPRNVTGKVLKRDLRERFSGAPASA
jgi:acyl-CoA synthetase (AMP-forming)/AMP-acid ligase II